MQLLVLMMGTSSAGRVNPINGPPMITIGCVFVT